MGKRGRKSAKTGDKSLYKNRDSTGDDYIPKNNDDGDRMYDKVDQFHSRRDEDFLRLEQHVQDSEDEEIEEAVMDLGIDGDSSEDDTGSDDDAQIDAGRHEPDSEYSSEEENLSVSSDDGDEDDEDGDARKWGKKKSVYYHGDTADLEIGQEEEDAYVEAEAAKSIQAARLKEMSEDDFIISDDDEKKEEQDTDMSGMRDFSKLSRKEMAKLVDKQHPEMLPLVSHFRKGFHDWEARTRVATEALLNGENGTAQVRNKSKIHKNSTNDRPLQRFISLTLW